MQLRKLYIKDYKLLKDFTIEFPFDFKRYISIFIGVNGSGKSTIIEAIAQIFSDIYLKKKAKFGFELEYSVRHEELIEETSTTSEFHTTYLLVKFYAQKEGDTIKKILHGANEKPLHEGQLLDKEKMVVVLAEKEIKSFSILPDNIVIYYSGLSEIMENLVEPHNLSLSKKYREGDTNLNRDFFYFEPSHFEIILLTLLSYQYGDIPEFLAEKAKIGGIQSIKIRLQKPSWANDSLDNFWGARGEVRNFLNYLGENSASMEDLNNPKSKKSAGNIVIEAWKDEFLIITIIGQQKLFEIREFLLEERKLFEILNIMLADGILKDIEFSLHKTDENRTGFNTLSEGEQQAIVIKGLTELLSEKNSLFLFDEPDTYLHPKWQRAFINNIEKTIDSSYDSENTFVITTHSPQLLSNANSELNFVKMIEEGKIVENTPKHYGRDIATVLYELMGVEERNEKIRERLSKLYLLIEEEEIEDAEKELSELKEIIGDDDPELKKAEIQINYLKEED